MEAAQALEQVRSHHGIEIVLRGKCPGGEVGAYSAWLGGSTPVVFKWSDRPERVDEWWGVVTRLERLRAVGYPVPRYYEPLVFPSGVVLMQEAMPGAWVDDVGSDLVESVIGLNGLQAGLGAPAPWTELMRRSLVEGCDGWCLHEPVRLHGRDGARLLAMVEAVGRAVPHLPTGDVVHLDFHHRNILRVGRRVSAVVDWEGCVDGDRLFDLVTFAFGLMDATMPEHLEVEVWDHLRSVIPEDHLTVYAAHMALRLADWKIRHHPSWVADEAIRVGSQRLGQLA